MKGYIHAPGDQVTGKEALIQPPVVPSEEDLAIAVPIRVEAEGKADNAVGFRDSIPLRRERVHQDCWLHGGLNE